MYTFFPLVTVLLCKALGFLDSIYLKTQKERIIPYLASMIYYFWMWYVIRNQPQYTSYIVVLTFAIFLASIVGLMSNIYIKISMHTIAIGIMLTFVISLGLTQPLRYGLYIAIALLIAGLVCTSRFIFCDKNARERYIKKNKPKIISKILLNVLASQTLISLLEWRYVNPNFGIWQKQKKIPTWQPTMKSLKH
jgi:hypothetical protein